MEANKQVNKDEVIQQLQNRSKELQNKIAHQKLHKLAIRRAAGIETNRAILAIDKNKRKYIIKDNGEELEMQKLYTLIMQNEHMADFTMAKQGMDKLVGDINMIIGMCCDGEDPDTCEISACSGSCATCGGCH